MYLLCKANTERHRPSSIHWFTLQVPHIEVDTRGIQQPKNSCMFALVVAWTPILESSPPLLAQCTRAERGPQEGSQEWKPKPKEGVWVQGVPSCKSTADPQVCPSVAGLGTGPSAVLGVQRGREASVQCFSSLILQQHALVIRKGTTLCSSCSTCDPVAC